MKAMVRLEKIAMDADNFHHPLDLQGHMGRVSRNGNNLNYGAMGKGEGGCYNKGRLYPNPLALTS
jgi:hypothetical protein